MNVIVLLAPGFEEVEALTVVDYLRRVSPIEVTMVSIGEGLRVSGSHQIEVKADCHIDEIKQPDAYAAVVIPGGMPGAANLRDDVRVINLIRAMAEAGKLVAAICAGPIVLEKARIIDGKNVTSYPGFEDELSHSHYHQNSVVQDGNIITARGPAKAVDFALALVTVLAGEPAAQTLAQKILYQTK